jgi:hypothetical protein
VRRERPGIRDKELDPELPVLEAMQLKAHDLLEAGLLTEPQHHDLFMVAAWDALDQPRRVVAREELAARLAADLVAEEALFSSDELQRLTRVRLDPGQGLPRVG